MKSDAAQSYWVHNLSPFIVRFSDSFGIRYYGFLILYAGVRAIGEVFREPDDSLLLGLSRGTFYSLFLVIGGLTLFAMSRRKPHRSKEELKG